MSDAAVADPVVDPTPTPAVDAGAPIDGAPAVVSDPAAPVADPPAEAPKPVEYALKLPENPSLDPASIERTVAIARERGLSPEAAQAALDLANTEAAEAVKASQQAFFDAWMPGDPATGTSPGAEWQKQHDAFMAAALADPRVGAGDNALLGTNIAKAARAMERFATPEYIAGMRATGQGSNPDVIASWLNVAKAAGELPLVVAGAEGSGDPARERLYSMYPTMRPKD